MCIKHSHNTPHIHKKSITDLLPQNVDTQKPKQKQKNSQKNFVCFVDLTNFVLF